MTEARARILVVDDDPDIRALLRHSLKGRYDVEVAGSGLQALAAIERARPDLLITDRMMPELDGLGLVLELRRRPETVALPILMLTALNASDATADGLEAGADDYLGKPFELPELLARVKSLLRRSTLAQAAAAPAFGVPQDATGYVAGLTLASVLQMLGLDRKTCDLRVTADGRSGTLALAAGELIDAGDGLSRGEAAAYRILGWRDARVAIQDPAPDRRRTIFTPLAHLLMEAVRRQDEAGAGSAVPPF